MSSRERGWAAFNSALVALELGLGLYVGTEERFRAVVGSGIDPTSIAIGLALGAAFPWLVVGGLAGRGTAPWEAPSWRRPPLVLGQPIHILAVLAVLLAALGVGVVAGGAASGSEASVAGVTFLAIAAGVALGTGLLALRYRSRMRARDGEGPPGDRAARDR